MQLGGDQLQPYPKNSTFKTRSSRYLQVDFGLMMSFNGNKLEGSAAAAENVSINQGMHIILLLTSLGFFVTKMYFMLC